MDTWTCSPGLKGGRPVKSKASAPFNNKTEPKRLTKIWATRAPKRISQVTTTATARLLGFRSLIRRPDTFHPLCRLLEVLRYVIIALQKECLLGLLDSRRRLGLLLLLKLLQPARAILARPAPLDRFPILRREHAVRPGTVCRSQERFTTVRNKRRVNRPESSFASLVPIPTEL